MYRFKIILLIGLALLLAGCGTETASPVPEPTSTATDPDPEPTSTEPAEEANAGQTVFRTRCASCHYLTDMQQVGPGLAGLFNLETLPDGQAFSEEALVSWIVQGGGAMAGVSLSADEIAILIPYLREATAQ